MMIWPVIVEASGQSEAAGYLGFLVVERKVRPVLKTRLKLTRQSEVSN